MKGLREEGYSRIFNMEVGGNTANVPANVKGIVLKFMDTQSEGYEFPSPLTTVSLSVRRTTSVTLSVGVNLISLVP